MMYIGWIITDNGKDFVADTLAIFEKLGKFFQDGKGYFFPTEDQEIPQLQIECHVLNNGRVYIKHHELQHGEHDFRQPYLLTKNVRKFLGDNIPQFFGKYEVFWGIIDADPK